MDVSSDTRAPATSQSPLQLFCKRRARMDAERERLRRACLGRPIRSTGQAASHRSSVPCPSPPRPLADRGWPALRIHVGGWCLVGRTRIFRLRFDPPVRSTPSAAVLVICNHRHRDVSPADATRREESNAFIRRPVVAIFAARLV